MSEVTLESLVGEHELSGVDMTKLTEKGEWNDDYASVCMFVLDGRTYIATEDPNDGYRSSMQSLTEGGECKNRFTPQRVLCAMRVEGEYGSKDDTLVMTDMVTGETVLEVGTDNTDDYYPSFVANFQPQNMACNRQS